MYKSIENEFKKESIYNKRDRSMFIIYLIVFTIVSIFTVIFKLHFLIMLISIIFLFFLVLAVKTIITHRIKITNKQQLQEYIKEMDKKELATLRNILKNNNLYNEKIINDFIEHYRNLISSPRINKISIIEIITIITSIGIYVYDEVTLTINSQKLFSMISIIISTMVLYFLHTQFKDTIIILKGEENIYERLEALFNNLYIEMINNNGIKVKKKRHK